MWLDDVIPLSRPLLSVVNDPAIPSSSTALTNQMPELAPEAPPIPANGSSLSHSPANDTPPLHAPVAETMEMEVEEDELDED